MICKKIAIWFLIAWCSTFNLYLSHTSYAPNTYIAFVSGFTTPIAAAVTPNNLYTYVTDSGSDSVVVIDTNPDSPTFNTVISTPALDGTFDGPSGIAITPNGQFAYVTNNTNNSVLVINIATNTLVNAPLLMSTFNSPGSIAITPNGQYAYVVNAGNSVAIINLANNSVSFPAALTGTFPAPFIIAITPSGNYAYVTNLSGSVSVIDTTVNMLVAAPGLASVNPQPQSIAITTNGLFGYVTDGSNGDVTVIDTNPDSPTVNTVLGSITGFDFPNGIVTTADGNYAYVSNFIGASGSISSVTVIDTNPNSPTYNTTLNTPGLIVPSPPPFTRFLSIAASPNARFVYAVDGFNATVDVIYTGILTQPLNFTGCKMTNRFLLQIDYINHLTWSAPVIGNPPAAYILYRDAALQNVVATIPASGPLEYDDHGQLPDGTSTYYIVSTDGMGNISPAASVTVTAPCS